MHSQNSQLVPPNGSINQVRRFWRQRPVEIQIRRNRNIHRKNIAQPATIDDFLDLVNGGPFLPLQSDHRLHTLPSGQSRQLRDLLVVRGKRPLAEDIFASQDSRFGNLVVRVDSSGYDDEVYVGVCT